MLNNIDRSQCLVTPLALLASGIPPARARTNGRAMCFEISKPDNALGDPILVVVPSLLVTLPWPDAMNE
jgi:hypothetical protein